MTGILVTECRKLFEKKIQLAVVLLSTTLLGSATWLSCDGIVFVWKVTRHPPLTLPIYAFFLFWVLTYVVFGILIVLNMRCECSFNICFRCTCAYLISLFWCPLGPMAGAWIMAALSVAATLLILLTVLIKRNSVSVLGTLLGIVLIVFLIYTLLISISMAFFC